MNRIRFSQFASKDNTIQTIVRALQKHLEASSKVRLWTDNGSQYINDAFEDSMKDLNVQHKFIAYHRPEQDPYIESFHGRFKKEYIWVWDFKSFQQADAAISEASIDYNQRRPHSALG